MTTFTTYSVPLITGMQEENDGPGTIGIVEESQLEALQIALDSWGSTLQLRASAESYLPQFPKEENDAYETRTAQAVFYNAFKRTIKGLTGMVFRKPVAFSESVPEQVIDLVPNIDLLGHSVNVFAQELHRSKTRDGHACILVDWKEATGARTRREERQAGSRPYWTMIRKGQILRHETINDNGEEILVMFAYMESVVARAGRFAQTQFHRVHQYDLLFPGEDLQSILAEDEFPQQKGPEEQAEEGDSLPSLPATIPGNEPQVLHRSWTREIGVADSKWVPELSKFKLLGSQMTRIPVVVDYGEREGYLLSQPPLLDLALENIRHFQLRSDRDTGLHTALIDIFVMVGCRAEDVGIVTVGASIGVALPEVEMDAKYVGAEARGLEEARTELQDIELRMSSLGLSMLQRQTRAAETAEAKRLDESQQSSELASSAIDTQSALQEALVLTAQWMGVDWVPEEGDVEVNLDFGIEPLDPAMVREIRAAVAEGSLSVETMWDMLEQGELLPDSFDPEEEKLRLEQKSQDDLKKAADMAKAMAAATAEPAEEE